MAVLNGGARDKNEALRREAELSSLKLIIADQERHLARLESERKSLIPTGEVHDQLDRLNLPRRSPEGRLLVIGERFALLRARLQSEERER